MNDKILSLIVPTYNMEKYLRRCLDSVTRSDVPCSLEVVIVNDGSKDSSLEIAREYEKKRPDIVVVVDKPNGNYGSCVNAALPIVRGKYVKMLDADDWYETDGFITLLNNLDSVDCDMFITHHKWSFVDGSSVPLKYSSNWQSNRVYDVNEVFASDEFKRLQTHQIAFRTSLIRDMKYYQTEGISYTDAEWTYKPLYNVKKVAFFDCSVYCYFVGRAGQTMDSSVIAKSLSHEAKSLFSMLEFRKTQECVQEKNLEKYLSFRTENRAFNLFFNALIYASDEYFTALDLVSVEERLKEIGKPEYEALSHYDIRSFVIRRWLKTHKRPSRFVRYSIGKVFEIYTNVKKKWNPFN